jgi:hypothetical protein
MQFCDVLYQVEQGGWIETVIRELRAFVVCEFADRYFYCIMVYFFYINSIVI